jgi:hypothetical protein
MVVAVPTPASSTAPKRLKETKTGTGVYRPLLKRGNANCAERPSSSLRLTQYEVYRNFLYRYIVIGDY